MAALSPTVVCCGKAEANAFPFRDIVLGTSTLIKDIAARHGSSATTIKSLPDFYSAIEVAPYINCIKFAALWTSGSTKRAYINLSLQSERVAGLTQEECLNVALEECWEAQFSYTVDTATIAFIPDSEQLLKRLPGVMYHADTKVPFKIHPEDVALASVKPAHEETAEEVSPEVPEYDFVQTRIESTQDESAGILKELEQLFQNKMKEKQKIEFLEGILLDVNRELQTARSQLFKYTNELAVLEERYSKFEKRTITHSGSETLQISKEFLREFIEIANRIISSTSPISIRPGSTQPSSDLRVDPFQGDVQKLIAVLEDQVQVFHVATRQWQQLLALRQNIQVDHTTASTFIPPNRIFVCGGGFPNACTRHVGRSAYMLEGDGSARELPRMSTGRIAPGVAWDSVRQALYVFGGGNTGTCYTVSLRASEMFLSEWSPLPDMHQARECFNPCWHSSIVYLCGGWTNSVETYDPRSNTFVLQDFTLPESRDTTAVVENGTLTVISGNYISKLQQGRLTSQVHPFYGPWSNCTPLVSGGVVYVYYGGTCSCIDLTTGALQKEVNLS